MCEVEIGLGPHWKFYRRIKYKNKHIHFQLIKTPTLDFPNLQDLINLKRLFFFKIWLTMGNI